MKTITCILLLFFALPLTSIAQNDSILYNKETSNFKNQIDLDFEILAFSLSYKHKISENWMVGPSIGVGLSAQFIKDFSVNYQYGVALKPWHIGVVFKYYQTKRLQFEIGASYILLIDIQSINAEGNYSNELMGIDFGLYYGNKVQIGIKTNLGLFKNDRLKEDINSHRVLSGNLLIRIPIKW